MKPSAEEIEEKRRLRKLKKAEKAAKPQAKTEFTIRPFLRVADATTGKLALKIMTYNVLAQALVRRHLFPTSGNALKWLYRGPAIVDEIKHYDCDIVCFQEVDEGSLLISALADLGYTTNFHKHASKRHGLMIAFKKILFQKNTFRFINYDGVKQLPNSVETLNVGQIMALDFLPLVVEKYPYLQSKSVLIGTNHLYWHPNGCYERTRQTAIAKQEMHAFERDLKAISPESSFYKFFAGDFNLEPFDPPYLLMRNLGCTDKDRKVLYDSINWFQNRIDSEDEQLQFKQPADCDYVDPVPMVEAVEQAHAKTNIEVHSALECYSRVDSENSQHHGEPLYSNWAHAWRGLLDYIFIMGTPNYRVVEVLRMPPAKELGDEGLPQLHKYPSDHLSVAATIELN